MSSPHDAPYTMVHNPGAGQHQFIGQQDIPIDPHSVPFIDVTDDLGASKVDGPVPPNIIGG